MFLIKIKNNGDPNTYYVRAEDEEVYCVVEQLYVGGEEDV